MFLARVEIVLKFEERRHADFVHSIRRFDKQRLDQRENVFHRDIFAHAFRRHCPRGNSGAFSKRAQAFLPGSAFGGRAIEDALPSFELRRNGFGDAFELAIGPDGTGQTLLVGPKESFIIQAAFEHRAGLAFYLLIRSGNVLALVVVVGFQFRSAGGKGPAIRVGRRVLSECIKRRARDTNTQKHYRFSELGFSEHGGPPPAAWRRRQWSRPGWAATDCPGWRAALAHSTGARGRGFDRDRRWPIPGE